MCGILGEISLSNNLSDTKNFKKALNLQYHRGPDDIGIYKDKLAILGHRRLSIIDINPRSKQPMISKCGNYVIVFNGEIYNYQEIKTTLIKKGYSFFTLSDTEVLLNAFIEDGIACLNYLNGMFAFCIYDKKKETFYIARDRLGIKPLYFSKDNNRFIFSSEIKSILALDKKKRKLDIKALSSYLSFRYPILNNTFFEGINSLEAAHYIKVSKSEYKIIEYWNISNRYLNQKDMGEEYYKDKLYKLLDESVKYRMNTNVPFGAFLSGGVDSSIITALMSKNSNEQIRTFTIGFEEDNFNEFEYANMIVNRFNTKHTEITIHYDSYINSLNELIRYKDSPLSVPNEIALYLMSKELKKYITVVLSGEGADEIFGGYGRIFKSPYDYIRMQYIDKLNFSNREKEIFRRNYLRKYGTIYGSELEHFVNNYSYTKYRDKEILFDKSIKVKSIEEELRNKFNNYFNELKGASYYNKILYAFEKIHLIGLLHRVDTTTMASSVEARLPFLDHRIVEFIATLPFEYKIKWKSLISKEQSKLLISDNISETYDIPKYILKKSFENIIPKEILYRKKVGFPVPLKEWFEKDLNHYAKKILLSKTAINRGLFNIQYIQSLIDNIHNNRHLVITLWMLINLELFIRIYFDEDEFINY